jgi:putative flippase GtrA
MIKKILNKVVNSRFIRFLFVGVLNTVFGYLIYVLFVFLGLHYSLTVFCSTFLGALLNFKTIEVFVLKVIIISLFLDFLRYMQ